MAVAVSFGPPFEVSAPKPLVEDTFWNAAGGHTYYAVMPDGKLVMLEAEGAREGAYVNVVVNWFEELEARVPRRSHRSPALADRARTMRDRVAFRQPVVQVADDELVELLLGVLVELVEP